MAKAAPRKKSPKAVVKNDDGGSSSLWKYIIVALVVISGAVYYYKVVKNGGGDSGGGSGDGSGDGGGDEQKEKEYTSPTSPAVLPEKLTAPPEVPAVIQGELVGSHVDEKKTFKWVSMPFTAGHKKEAWKDYWEYLEEPSLEKKFMKRLPAPQFVPVKSLDDDLGQVATKFFQNHGCVRMFLFLEVGGGSADNLNRRVPPTLGAPLYLKGKTVQQLEYTEPAPDLPDGGWTYAVALKRHVYPLTYLTNLYFSHHVDKAAFETFLASHWRNAYLTAAVAVHVAAGNAFHDIRGPELLPQWKAGAVPASDAFIKMWLDDPDVETPPTFTYRLAFGPLNDQTGIPSRFADIIEAKREEIPAIFEKVKKFFDETIPTLCDYVVDNETGRKLGDIYTSAIDVEFGRPKDGYRTPHYELPILNEQGLMGLSKEKKAIFALPDSKLFHLRADLRKLFTGLEKLDAYTYDILQGILAQKPCMPDIMHNLSYHATKYVFTDLLVCICISVSLFFHVVFWSKEKFKWDFDDGNDSEPPVKENMSGRRYAARSHYNRSRSNRMQPPSILEIYYNSHRIKR